MIKQYGEEETKMILTQGLQHKDTRVLLGHYNQIVEIEKRYPDVATAPWRAPTTRIKEKEDKDSSRFK